MPKVIPVGSGEATLRYHLTGDSEDYALVFGLDFSSPPTQSGLATLMAALANAINDQMSSSYSWVGWRFEYQGDPNVEIFEGSLAIAGARSGAVDKQNVAVLIRKNTAIGGRLGKGRMFISGVINGDATDAGVLTTTARNNWDTAAAAFLALVDDDPQLVLFHDVDSSNPFFGEGTPVTSLTTQSTLATQRRRLRR